MKKLMLELEELAVETFEVVAPREPARGTVKAAEAYTMFLSGCLTCGPSGAIRCFNTQDCC